MKSEAEILEAAREFLSQEVRLRASEIDADPEALRVALQGLCERGLMALRRPEAWGGPALSEAGFRTFQENVARVSGSLAFLQTQHQSAVSLLSKSENTELQAKTLPHMHNGENLIGIGFSQLRRAGPPMLRAEQVEGGFRLSGTVPWVTGYGFFSEFLIGAALPDGRSVFGLVPFSNQDQPDGTIRFRSPMRLAAMESAQTVEADLENWFLADADVAFIKPVRWIQLNDQINVALQGWFAIGCARGSLDILEELEVKRKNAVLSEVARDLGNELEELRHSMIEAQNCGSDETTDHRLELRAHAIDLAVRMAHAAIAATGGSANAVGHPAQRLYREALVYTVSAQTEAIREATLRRLTRPTRTG